MPFNCHIRSGRQLAIAIFMRDRDGCFLSKHDFNIGGWYVGENKLEPLYPHQLSEYFKLNQISVDPDFCFSGRSVDQIYLRFKPRLIFQNHQGSSPPGVILQRNSDNVKKKAYLEMRSSVAPIETVEQFVRRRGRGKRLELV